MQRMRGRLDGNSHCGYESVGWRGGHGFTVFDQALHYQSDHFLNVAQSLVLGLSPGGGAVALKEGEVCAPAVFIWLHDYGKRIMFQFACLQCTSYCFDFASQFTVT